MENISNFDNLSIVVPFISIIIVLSLWVWWMQNMYVDIGCNGRVSDGGVFKNCSLWKALEKRDLNIPNPSWGGGGGGGGALGITLVSTPLRLWRALRNIGKHVF